MASAAAASGLRAMPSPPLKPLIGHTLAFGKGIAEGIKENRPFQFMRQWFDQYGPIVHLDMLVIGKAVLLGDPDLVKYVTRNDPARFTKGTSYDMIKRGWLDDSLVVSEGEVWRQKRSVYNRAFKLGAIRSYAPVFEEIAKSTADKWQIAHERGENVDAVKAFEQVAFEAIGRAGFGVAGLGAHDNKYADAFANYTSVLNWENNGLARLMPPVARRVSAWRGRGYLETMQAESRRIVEQSIEAASTSATDRVDEAAAKSHRNLVALMREASAEEGYPEADADHLAREANLFLFAGHDTTSATMAWAWAMLGAHPEVQQRAFEEVAAVPPEALLSELSDPRSLPYLGAVVRETLRLYPPATMVLRNSKYEEELLGYRIPAGVNYIPAIWAIHRDPNVFEAADAFRPERWHDAAGERLKRMQDHWMPFMIGARGCIGQQFSLMEMRVVLATLLRRFRAELVSEPKTVQRMLTLPADISLRVAPR